MRYISHKKEKHLMFPCLKTKKKKKKKKKKKSPSYHHHHHHLSHVLAINLGLVSLWWAVTLFLLARNREAMQQKWAHRLFGFPVLVLAVIGAVTAYYLYWTIDVHDEVCFVLFLRKKLMIYSFLLSFLNRLLMLLFWVLRTDPCFVS